MAKAKKILYITQEIAPFVADSVCSRFGREVAEATQGRGREIRSFMPKWGVINERRNQLHEVIRLSGMNIIVDETDHTLVIKVASIPSSRMQVYFIDNDDFFTRRLMMKDAKGKEYADNAERAVFFARGVLETVKKLRWVPEIIHCQGWMSSVVPLYIKTAYKEEPSFRDCRVVFTPSEDNLKAPLPKNIDGALQFRTAGGDALKDLPCSTATEALNYMGMKYADGVTLMRPNTAYRAFIREAEKPYLAAQKPENYATAYPAFYDKVWSIGKEDEREEEDD